LEISVQCRLPSIAGRSGRVGRTRLRNVAKDGEFPVGTQIDPTGSFAARDRLVQVSVTEMDSSKSITSCSSPRTKESM
jgi:dihydrodipicolinate reductase